MDEVKVNWLIVITPSVNKNQVDAILKQKNSIRKHKNSFCTISK